MEESFDWLNHTQAQEVIDWLKPTLISYDWSIENGLWLRKPNGYWKYIPYESRITIDKKTDDIKVTRI